MKPSLLIALVGFVALGAVAQTPIELDTHGAGASPHELDTHQGGAPPIELDTHAGDAWTFVLPASGRFDPQRCASVVVETAVARIEALRIVDRFHANTPLLPGRNELRAVCRGKDGEPIVSRLQTWHAALPDLPKAWIRVGVQASVRQTGPDVGVQTGSDDPGVQTGSAADDVGVQDGSERVDVQDGQVGVQGGSIQLDSGRTARAAALPAPITRFEWRARGGNPAPLRTIDGKTLSADAPLESEQLQLANPARDGDYYVTLRVTDALGRADESTAVFRVSAGSPETIDLRSEHPGWFDAAVLYGAAPYMFEPQGLRGIEDRLDEIAALGATAIWISPVTSAAPDDFGYAVVDQFSIRTDFGGAAALRSVVDTAHRLGLRVLVDFVPNHFSQFHAYYADAERYGPRSPYYDWFDRDSTGKITQYFDWQHLKNLNFDNAAVRNHIIAAAARFVRVFDVDGFRVDASWGVARRAPEFWPLLREELKRIDPDIVLIAEASAREAYHVANGFDAAYDWTENLGEWAWRDVFRDDGSVDVPRLRAALTNDGRGYPPDTLILRFVNNNDTGERFISRFGEDTTRLAATLLFTLPGIPLIYNGDEVGAEFLPYEEDPPIRWQETPLTEHYRKLTTLRREVGALRSRQLVMLRTNHDDSVLAFLRPGLNGASDVIVLLNFGRSAADIEAADATTREVLAREAERVDLLTGTRVATRTGIRLPARSARILAGR